MSHSNPENVLLKKRNRNRLLKQSFFVACFCFVFKRTHNEKKAQIEAGFLLVDTFSISLCYEVKTVKVKPGLLVTWRSCLKGSLIILVSTFCAVIHIEGKMPEHFF